MVTDRFGALLEELGTVVHVPLKPDAHNACKLRFPPDNLTVYMEPDAPGENIQIIIDIGKPGEGKYRENLLREALRANGVPPPRLGTFCYGQKGETLLLYDLIPLEDLNGTRLSDIISQFCEKARIWREAIGRGELPPFRSGRSAAKAEGIFGLR